MPASDQFAAARRIRTRYIVSEPDVTIRRQPRPAPRRQGTRRSVILAALREG